MWLPSAVLERFGAAERVYEDELEDFLVDVMSAEFNSEVEAAVCKHVVKQIIVRSPRACRCLATKKATGGASTLHQNGSCRHAFSHRVFTILFYFFKKRSQKRDALTCTADRCCYLDVTITSRHSCRHSSWTVIKEAAMIFGRTSQNGQGEALQNTWLKRLTLFWRVPVGPPEIANQH